MKTIDWKNSYISPLNINIAPTAKYYSISGRVGALGTREDPYQPSVAMTSANKDWVLGNGNFALRITSWYYYNTLCGTMVGSGIGKTFVDISGTNANIPLQASDLTLKSYLPLTPFLDVYTQIWVRVYFDNIPKMMTRISGGYMSNCIFKKQISCPVAQLLQSTYVEVLEDANYVNAGLMVKCQVRITQAKLDSYKTYYWAFNNCSFIIGNEATATPLVGSNAVELRANFVSRCVTQGLTVPNINDFGVNVPSGRWEFSNTSIVGEYDLLQGSEIDIFAKLRGIYFGYSNVTVKQVPITTTLNIPASFNTQTPVKEALVTQNSIGLLANSDITKRVEAYADSKIIWLGGLAKLSLLSLVQNLPSDTGVAPDSVYGLAKTPTASGSIAVSHYIIRSNNDQTATIKYNNVVYTSSLITRNNVFLGVTGVTTFENTTGNAELYQVIDFANHQSIQIRLMREIPSGNITTGNLQAGYWYFVEPNNLSDTSGTITYKGVVRPAFDSFLVDAANLTFTVNGTCHLRRCWKQDFDFATETTDKAFWTDRQKPSYYDIVSDDLRCLLKNNSSASVELADSDGVYIGSGHPEFYNAINGVNGLRLPAYDIVGSFLQIRVPITTINPM